MEGNGEFNYTQIRAKVSTIFLNSLYWYMEISSSSDPKRLIVIILRSVVHCKIVNDPAKLAPRPIKNCLDDIISYLKSCEAILNLFTLDLLKKKNEKGFIQERSEAK